MKQRLLLAGVCLGLVALASACGDDSEVASAPAVVRLGYFANVTHAPAIVALEQGYLGEALGAGVTLETRTFNAGPEAVEALFSEALDLTYIGPNPAINAFAQSEGQAIRIVAGATSGGAALVVQPSITKPADLAGKKLATPAARQHAGRRAARVAEGRRASPRTSKAAATSRSCRRRTRRRSRRSARARSRAPGCPSPGPRASCSRAAAWCWWTSAASGRTGSS